MPINSKAIKILPGSKNMPYYSLCQSIKMLSLSPLVKVLTTYTIAITRNMLMLSMVLNMSPSIRQPISYTCWLFPVFPPYIFLFSISPPFCKATVLTWISHRSSWECLCSTWRFPSSQPCWRICHVLLAIVYIHFLYGFPLW